MKGRCDLERSAGRKTNDGEEGHECDGYLGYRWTALVIQVDCPTQDALYPPSPPLAEARRGFSEKLVAGDLISTPHAA